MHVVITHTQKNQGKVRKRDRKIEKKKEKVREIIVWVQCCYRNKNSGKGKKPADTLGWRDRVHSIFDIM